MHLAGSADRLVRFLNHVAGFRIHEPADGHVAGDVKIRVHAADFSVPAAAKMKAGSSKCWPM